MHQWLSWEDLVKMVIVGMAFYYIGWVVIFVRARRFRRKSKDGPAVWTRTEATPSPEPVATTVSSMSAVHDLIEELKMVWIAAKKEELNKEQITSAIRHRLSRYEPLKKSPLQGSVNLHIIQECLKETQVGLTEAEVMALWK